jgi:hypothetical protein
MSKLAALSLSLSLSLSCRLTLSQRSLVGNSGTQSQRAAKCHFGDDLVNAQTKQAQTDLTLSYLATPWLCHQNRGKPASQPT